MRFSLARICHMYYNEGLTQQQIANRLQISRIKVSRMLQQARDEGVVKIEIRHDGFFLELEQQLAQRYGIQFIVVDALDGQPEALRDALGATGAQYLGQIMTPRSVVTVGWGTTLRSIADHLSVQAPTVTFVPFVGGQANVVLDMHANSIAARMAAKTGGRSEALFAPAVADSVESRDTLVSSRPVSRVLNMAINAPICVFSLGAPFEPTSSITMVGYYTPADIQKLRDSDAACDLISAAYFTKDGRRCAEEISDRTVSMTAEQLSAIPHKVCVAGGSEKHESIRIALEQRRYIDMMILDSESARYLLSK